MPEAKSCLPTLSRRQWFRVGGVGVSGFFLNPFAPPVNAWAKERVQPRGAADACIFINLAGGASHVDTFDVKEGRWLPKDWDIRTVKPGMCMPYRLFPMLSEGTGDLAIVRSLRAWENEHIRAQYYLQVAHSPSPSRMKEIPSLGSVIAYEFDGRRTDRDFLPPFIAMNFTSGAFKVVGEGCLDSRNAPLPLEISESGFDFMLSETEQPRFRRRWEFLQKMERPDATDRYFQEFRAYYQGARAMMESPGIRTILTLPQEERKRYGGTPLGDACLLARNLVEAKAGTRFVMISHHGWDLHAKIYDQNAQAKLGRELDTALANLLRDLKAKNLLSRTFVCCMGEFGRTPGELTVNQGRDHFKDAFAGVFAGAGVAGGRAIGKTSESGDAIVDFGWRKKRPIYMEDVAATIYSVLGIDWTKTIEHTPSGRVFEYIENQSGTDFIDSGEIAELFG
jgi:hypothetical protein